MLKIKLILCQPSIPYKRFERLVGKLRHATIGFPVRRGIYAPFNRTIDVDPKMMVLVKNGLVHKVFSDWGRLLIYIQIQPTYVKELVGQDTSNVRNMDTSGNGASSI